MRHFTSQSPIMAELQLQQEVEPQLLNWDDFIAAREDAESSESVKKKRRKKKRNKTTAPGERHRLAFIVWFRLCKIGTFSATNRYAGRETFQPVGEYFSPALTTLRGSFWN